MKANVGGIDRALRVTIGLALLSLVLFGHGGVRWFGLIGLVPLATGIFGYCPMYPLFGWNTCPKETPPLGKA